jgi:serine/threonine-protein kinase
MIGTTLGHYRIAAKLGEGGMGAVYRATDIRLQRDVAIKVLLPQVAADAERLGRFEREARVLATLNHPGIASVYGFDRDGDTPFLAMEYVAGSTLSDLVGKLDEADVERYALQMAEAIAAAHEKSIIHRDLKPANVKVTPEGKIKILDFGLAKAMAGEASGAAAGQTMMTRTIATGATQVGVIMGTPAYMSPEQARGKAVDKRSDIWAFGALVYEMFSGRPAFGGETITDVFAHIVKDDPDWSVVPLRWRRALQACLDKDADKRLRDVGDIGLLLGTAEVSPVAAVPKRRNWWLPVACAVGGVAVGFAAMWGSRPAEAPKPVSRFLISPDVRSDREATFAISQNGRKILYQEGNSVGNAAVVRELDQAKTRRLTAFHSIFSPDGRSVASFSLNSLRIISLENGTSTQITKDASEYGGSWGDDDTIVFRNANGGVLLRAGLHGDPPQKISSETLAYPSWVPGSEWVLAAQPVPDNSSNVVALNVKTQEIRKLASNGTKPHYVDPGYLVYQSGQALHAAVLNRRTMAVTGTPLRLLEEVQYFDVSRTGTLLYSTATEGESSELIQINRTGVISRVALVKGTFSQMSLSPDGRRLLLANTGTETDIWLYDFDRRVVTRLTTEAGEDEYPVWSPDGQRYAFCTQRVGEVRKMVIRAPDSGTQEELIDSSPGHAHLGSWSIDGTLFYSIREGELKTASKQGDWKTRTWLKAGFRESSPVVSPDGKWVAYASYQTSRREIFVRPAHAEGHWQVSIEGATSEPRWSANGKEIFYVEDRKMMLVPVETSGGFKPGAPRALFEMAEKISSQFSVTNDGRFLTLRRPQTGTKSELWLVENWVEELKQKVRP